MEKSFKKYLLFWFGGSVSQLGSAMTSFALILWTYTQTKSAMAVSLMSFCNYLPYILVSLFAGGEEGGNMVISIGSFGFKPAPQENHYARSGLHRGHLFLFCPAVLAVRGAENPVHLRGQLRDRIYEFLSDTGSVGGGGNSGAQG